METAFLLISLAIVVIVGIGLSERLRIAAPMLLLAVGVLGSYLPFVPEVHLEPEVVLLGLLPPLLHATAIQTSLTDIRANAGRIVQLSVVLVVVTTVTVAAVVMLVLPTVGWPAALAIGAVVAPPDAVAATAVARRIGLPRTVVRLLEAESLLNDATALVALRTATAAFAVAVTARDVVLDFAVAAGGGALLGLGLFWVVATVRRRLRNPLLDTAISFVTPFAAYVVAEEFHASGVIAVVVSALLLGHQAPLIQTASSRITESVTWRTVAFMLENSVFLLIGLQTQTILADVAASDLGAGRVLLVCLTTLATVVLVRLAYVVVTSRLTRAGRRSQESSLAESVLIGWAGMRGVVTLAAALTLPEDTPHREVLLLAALTVVVGTLFGQGLTLPWLTRRLGVPPPDPALDALERATLLQRASDAGLERMAELDLAEDSGVAEAIRTRVERRTFAAWERLSTRGDESPSEVYARVRQEMLRAERARVLEVRSTGGVPSEVLREVLGMLDLEESMLDIASEERRHIRHAPIGADGGGCDDLVAHPAVETAPDPRCVACDEAGLRPVALRQCLTCGHVGCCDSSAGQHATRHFHDTGHPVMESAEPGENWRWCYVHQLTS